MPRAGVKQLSAPFLSTKLYIPPARPMLVSRPRLTERLDAGLHRKLTLISAPAGFGKTTLLSEWVAGSERPVAWVSLDEDDSDPARFLTYLIAALQTIEADVGKGALSALQSPQPPPTEAMLAALINEIAAIPNPIVLVLDDYHLIEAQSVHDTLTFLLRHRPPQMHLVIATRDDPQLPLARLRGRGQLTELRGADLRFTSSEAAEFLNQVMGLDLSTEDIVALETRTEGWIAGLQLAAISMQGRGDTASLIRSFTGSHHYVLDYLIEEVLDQQSEDVQAFLLQTAVLDRLSGSLCDAVRFGSAKSPSSSSGTALTGQENGQATLEMLQRANLFIVPLDNERRWYRYHHLFADLLRLRLRQTQPEQVSALHRRASEWYEQNGFADEAIEHALRGDDLERAAHLIERHVDAVWERGEHVKLRRWLDKLPVELVFPKPHLCIFHAWNLFTRGQQDAAEQSLHAVEQTLDSSDYYANEAAPIEKGQPPGADLLELRGRVAAIRSFVASFRSDAPEIIKHAHEALDFLPEEDFTWRSTATSALGDAYSLVGDLAAAYRVRLEALEASKAEGNIYMILIASGKLAVTLRQQGQLEQAIEIYHQQLQLADEHGLSQTVVIGWLLATWGLVLADLNDLDGALHLAKEGVGLTGHGNDVSMIGWSRLCLARVLFSRGDTAGAEEIILEMESIARESTVPPWIANQMAAWQARIWLAQDKLDAASQWAQKRGLSPDEEPVYVGGLEYGVLARILLAQGRLDETLTLLQGMLRVAEAGGHVTRVMEILRLRALALQTRGDTAEAMIALKHALTLAEPGGFIRIFVDEGPPMARLLYKALSHGVAPDYVRRLLEAFPSAEPEQAVPSKRQTRADLIEPLSERELEVLQLVAEGLTNPEIAARLFLSLNTVKVHTRNIYGKLGVRNRTEAVARGRALGVLAYT
jgi:LuxR family maltose regulon positive regulatory protein